LRVQAMFPAVEFRRLLLKLPGNLAGLQQQPIVTAVGEFFRRKFVLEINRGSDRFGQCFAWMGGVEAQVDPGRAGCFPRWC
jgi:hypothetical protein